MNESAETLGLPTNIRALLFDLDGVLTETATLHAKAWKQLFDDFLKKRAEATGETFVPFDIVNDFEAYVNGKPRNDGTRSFLAARSIDLPEGDADDPKTAETVRGLGAKKDEIFHELLRSEGVHAFPGSVRYLQAARDAGKQIAVVSSSRNCKAIVAAAHIEDFFDVRIDGVTASDQHLAGKPAPDTYLAAAKALGVSASEAAVFEDAPSGVEAGSRGHFGFVVGVDREGKPDELRSRGASTVVGDLGELLNGR